MVSPTRVRWTLATGATGLLDASSFTNAAAPNMANTKPRSQEPQQRLRPSPSPSPATVSRPKESGTPEHHRVGALWRQDPRRRVVLGTDPSRSEPRTEPEKYRISRCLVAGSSAFFGRLPSLVCLVARESGDVVEGRDLCCDHRPAVAGAAMAVGESADPPPLVAVGGGRDECLGECLLVVRGTNQPVPSGTISAGPCVAVAMTGSPQAIASTSASPNASLAEGKTSRSAAFSASGSSLPPQSGLAFNPPP